MDDILKNALLGLEKPSAWFDDMMDKGALQGLFPEIASLYGVQQDKVHHPEGDVYTHTMMMVDYAAGLRDQAEKLYGFMLSALCHDFGKPFVTRTEKDGRLHAYGHEEAGIPVARRMLSRIGAGPDMAGYVESMVSLHMKPNLMYRDNPKIKVTNKLFDASACPDDLLLLAESDHFGRINPSPYGECREWLLERLGIYRETMARPYVSGDDLLSFGAKPGQELEELSAYAHKLRVSGVAKESVEKIVKAEIRKNRRREEFGNYK